MNDAMPGAALGPMMRMPLEMAGMWIDACEEGARSFWSLWGPLGEPAINMVEMVAGMQRRLLASVALSFGETGTGRA